MPLPIATGWTAGPGNILIGPGSGTIGVGTWIPNPAAPIVMRPLIMGAPVACVGDTVMFTYTIPPYGPQSIVITIAGASLFTTVNGVPIALVGTLVGGNVTIGPGPNLLVFA